MEPEPGGRTICTCFLFIAPKYIGKFHFSWKLYAIFCHSTSELEVFRCFSFEQLKISWQNPGVNIEIVFCAIQNWKPKEVSVSPRKIKNNKNHAYEFLSNKNKNNEILK